jgi:hypothetical protein
MIALGARGVIAVVLAAALAAVADGEARTHTEGRTAVPSIVARALPAVVSITTRQIERDQFNQSVPTRGLGSGFIVDPGGYVLTNLHVVQGAQDIKVTLTGGQSFRARLVGGDRFSELAVLKIDGTKLPTPDPLLRHAALPEAVLLLRREGRRRMSAALTFLGAAGTVTGSKHPVSSSGCPIRARRSCWSDIRRSGLEAASSRKVLVVAVALFGWRVLRDLRRRGFVRGCSAVCKATFERAPGKYAGK